MNKSRQEWRCQRYQGAGGHTCDFNGAGERFSNHPWGLFDGGSGAIGRFLHVDSAGEAKALVNKPSGIRLNPDERIIIDSPGAGGYGAPDDRDPAALEIDRQSGKFTSTYMDAHYGTESG